MTKTRDFHLLTTQLLETSCLFSFKSVLLRTSGKCQSIKRTACMLNFIYIVQCKWYLRLKISVQGPFKIYSSHWSMYVWVSSAFKTRLLLLLFFRSIYFDTVVKKPGARGAVFYIVLYVKAILNKILFKPTEQPKKDNTMVLKLRLRSTCRPYWWNCCQASCPPEASLTRSTWACPWNIYWLWPARPSTFSSTAPWAPSTAPLFEPCAAVGKSRIPTQDTPVIQGL